MIISNDLRRQIKFILIIDSFLILIGGTFLYLGLDKNDLYAILIACGLTTAYSLVGAYFMNRYFDAPFDIFMSKVFGAVFFRLAGLATAIFLILKFASIPEITFTVFVFISYISKSVQEIISINKKSVKSQNPG
jgi:hypothetical protein